MRTPIEYYIVDFERMPTAEALNEIGKEGWRLVAIRDIYAARPGSLGSLHLQSTEAR